MHEIALFLLLLAANGSPVAVRALLGGRLRTPLDAGLKLRDGRRLLGPSKTVIGVIGAILTTMLLAPLFGQPWTIGALIGAFAMLGDALSSFAKRRLGMAPGAMALGIDQVPESLLPMLVCKPLLGLGWWQVLGLTLAFTIANPLISQLFYRLGVRHHPH
jgi:CDP-2,3-bis-(O-geranylgeranyl)-sn-glycerol synthase